MEQLLATLLASAVIAAAEILLARLVQRLLSTPVVQPA